MQPIVIAIYIVMILVYAAMTIFAAAIYGLSKMGGDTSIDLISAVIILFLFTVPYGYSQWLISMAAA